MNHAPHFDVQKDAYRHTSDERLAAAITELERRLADPDLAAILRQESEVALAVAKAEQEKRAHPPAASSAARPAQPGGSLHPYFDARYRP